MTDSDNKRLYDAILSTPFAMLGLCFNNDRLTAVDYLGDREEKKSSNPVIIRLCEQIQQYCKTGPAFSGFCVETNISATVFQRRVLQEIARIPFGEVRKYGEIAHKLNTSPRAVGNACRRNPIPLIIPCHRVVAANGIGGYEGMRSGPRLAIKIQLLRHEGVVLDYPDFQIA